MSTRTPNVAIFSELGLLLGTLLATLCGHGSFLAALRCHYGVFWLAFSAYARLELQREPFQHHFNDLVLFLVPLLHIFDALLLKTHIIIASRLAPSMHPFSFPSSPLERVRCVVEAAPQARPEDHLGGIFCSSFVAEYHLGLTSALQHCQHNGAFRFLAAQVSIDFAWIRDHNLRSFG
jgi:hypothetical protein